MAALFANCFPSTLDTTVRPGSFEGKPDTVVVTGDIPAMWLRDSSAQVWPYLPLAKQDERLRALLEGVIRRQTRCLLIDPYANAFMTDPDAPPLEWSRKDRTTMKPGVAERKYELDSLCYTIRLAHGYWKATGDTRPFDSAWQKAMQVVLQTMHVEQQKNGPGPYHFEREAFAPTDTLVNGIGNPVKPVGLIASAFRPSDDACIFQFLVPSNLFAVRSLRQLAAMSQAVLHDSEMATQANTLADEVALALRKYAIASTSSGTIWAYEVDGFGGQILMDDANVPSLLSLPYLESSPDAALYARTRRFVWSEDNPWYFRAAALQGIGGPHIGRGSIWPMSQITYAMTSDADAEISHSIQMLKIGSAGTGFMHESYQANDPKIFTRSWFAWANTLFGELIGKTMLTRPQLLE
ncbi:MAG: glycoside hydrolase family 125 protein [Acidobacteriota bacterium]|nr:glycoside hydrolase family 125 protein [Acidobacteriota bacterium]